MNTKIIMTGSAILMGMVGVALTFMPQEIATYFSFPTETSSVIVFQILGALYFGFAMTNWTAKASLIGGIYARPIAIGNLTHFIIAALALVKAYSSSFLLALLVLTCIYSLFAIAFAIIFFTHPVKQKE